MKHISKITCYVLAAMLFWACQKDDTSIENSSESYEHSKTTRIISLQQNPELETIIRKVEQFRLQGHTISTHAENNTILGSLNLHAIISISDTNGNQSYTIDIQNTESGIHFEKLHLVKYMDGYIASIQRFEPTDNWDSSGNNMHTFTGQIKNFSLTNTLLWSATLHNGVVTNSSYGVTEGSVPCIVNIYWQDSEGQQYNEDPVDGDNYASAGITMVTEIVCDTDNANGSGSPSAGNNNSTGSIGGDTNGTFVGGASGGGSSSGGNNSNPTDGNNTSCNNCDTGTNVDLNVERTKRRLLNISNDPKIKAKLKDCKTKALNPNHYKEGGAAYRKKSDGTYEERLPSVVQGITTQFSPEYVPGESVYVHLHPQKTWFYPPNEPPVLEEVAPVPSKVDVVKFLGFMYERNHDTNEPASSDDDDEIVSILVTDIGTYALTVGNKANMLAADTAINSENSDDEVIREFIKQYETNIKEKCNDDACRVSEFIKFIKTHKIYENTLGIDMYQAIYTTDGIIGWGKL